MERRMMLISSFAPALLLAACRPATISLPPTVGSLSGWELSGESVWIKALGARAEALELPQPDGSQTAANHSGRGGGAPA